MECVPWTPTETGVCRCLLEDSGVDVTAIRARSREITGNRIVERAEWDDDVTDKVAHAMAQLDARSQAVLRARWMGEDKATLHELAEEYGVSAERIRQIEANAIKKLRKLVVADDA